MPWSRREFIRGLLAAAGAVGLGLSWVRETLAEIKKKVLPPKTDPGSLFHENPEYLDTRHLKPMPLGRFGTMGDTDIAVDPAAWRLTVDGAVGRKLSLKTGEIEVLPPVERNVLLVCPGFFSNHGTWRGVSIRVLLERAAADPAATKVRIFGKSPFGDKKEVFLRAEVESDQVFLAYAVNGEKLPRKHGFPLRLVAEGHWGAEWVKYVYRVKVE